MHRAKTISICNQKGGVAKTTTTVNLAAGLVRQGYDVLVMDCDPQGDLTKCFGWRDGDSLPVTLAALMQKVIRDIPFEPDEGILHHVEGVDLIPSNIELSAMEMTLINAMSRERTISTYLDKVKENYDYILIDCMPSLGMLTVNALTASDSVIIPVQAHYLSAIGMTQLLQTVNRVKRFTNPKLKVDGILLTMVDRRTNLSKEVGEIIRTSYGGKIQVYQSQIPMSVRAAEMSYTGKSIYEYDPKGAVAEAYEAFTKEVMRDAEKERAKVRDTECR